jgi:hypothetical protein
MLRRIKESDTNTTGTDKGIDWTTVLAASIGPQQRTLIDELVMWARGWIDGAGEENDSSHILIKESWRAHAHPTAHFHCLFY